MKKLQSLENFKSSGLNQKSMSKLVGGAVERTDGGELCTAATSTGCAAYEYDEKEGDSVTYKNYTEVDKPCEDD